MIAAGVLALAASGAMSDTAVHQPESQSAPRIVCEIEMPNWCIAHTDGTINMVDQGGTRRWSLQSRIFMRGGPLVIIESEACRSPSPFAPKLLSRAILEGDNGQRFNSVEYQIAKGGCTLEFRWPLLKDEDRSYEQQMLFGILIGEKEKSTQLYRLSKPAESE